MKVTEQFLKAKNSKDLTAIVFQGQPDGNQIIRLCIDERSQYSPDIKNSIYIETDTKFSIKNCSNKPITRISFYESVYGDSHIKTFLKAIQTNSEVSFLIIAYNGCESWDKVNFVSHQLYGYIGDNKYFLSTYIGNDSTASPVLSY